MKKKRNSRDPDDFPIATVAFYGPDDGHATKVVVGIVQDQNGDVALSGNGCRAQPT